MIFIIKSNILDRSLQSCNSLPAKVATQRSNSTQQLSSAAKTTATAPNPKSSKHTLSFKP